MDCQALAELLFPEVTETAEYMEKRFHPRNVPEGAVITRMAPSPTGFVHLGNLVQGLFAFLIGLYLNWVYEAEGSLLPAILTHAAVNGSTIFMEMKPEWQSVLYGNLPLYLTVTAVCLLAGFCIWKKFTI